MYRFLKFLLRIRCTVLFLTSLIPYELEFLSFLETNYLVNNWPIVFVIQWENFYHVCHVWLDLTKKRKIFLNFLIYTKIHIKAWEWVFRGWFLLRFCSVCCIYVFIFVIMCFTVNKNRFLLTWKITKKRKQVWYFLNLPYGIPPVTPFRDRSKFTGYLGRVLGKFWLCKKTFSGKKVMAL